jgi:outer membrane protein
MNRFRTIFAALSATAALIAPAAQAETLADAMIAAYRNSNLLEQNQALLRAVDEDVATAVAALRPVLLFTADAGVRRVNTGGNLGALSTNGWSDLASSVGLTAEMTLWDYGRGSLAVEAAKETVLATREALIGLEQQVLFAAVRAFIRVRVAEEVVALRQNNVRLLSEELKATQDRFDVGEVTRTDVALADSRLAAARSGLAAAEGDLLVAREEYKAATGAYPGDLQRAPPVPGLPGSVEAAQEIARLTHPSIRQAQREVTLSALNVARAEAAMGPNLVGRVQTNRTDGGITSDNVGVEYRQTIYAGGGLSAAYRAALARSSAARSNLLQAGVVISQEVGTAWSNLSVSAATIEATKQQVDAARIAFEGTREEANLGSRTTLDVLDAEQELLDAQFARLQAEAERYVAVYGLLSAVGLLTVDHLQLGIPTYDPAAYYNAVRNAPVTTPRGKRLDNILKKIGQ